MVRNHIQGYMLANAHSPHHCTQCSGSCRERPTLDSPTARTGSPRLLPPEANSTSTGLSEQTQQALNATGQQQLASTLEASNLPHEHAQGYQHAL